jgi:glucose-6-phosphate 1-epimerase
MVHPLPGRNDLPMLALKHPSGSTAEVYLNGGQVRSFIPAGGEEVLFLSRASRFEAGTPIRGGIPVVFPQFADLGPLPKHGFARTQVWSWDGDPGHYSEVPRAVLKLEASDETRQIWPHEFVAELVIELHEQNLSVSLSIRNPAAELIEFQAALHTYFRVASAAEAVVEGLHGVRYRDREEEEEQTQKAPGIRFGGLVDRVYLQAPSPLMLRDPSGNRAIEISSEGFEDAVVWNPWNELATELPDMDADEYLEMVCIEAAQVARPVSLGQGDLWRGSQTIRVR